MKDKKKRERERYIYICVCVSLVGAYNPIKLLRRMSAPPVGAREGQMQPAGIFDGEVQAEEGDGTDRPIARAMILAGVAP